MLTVAALYRFTAFADPAALKAPLEAVCREGDVRGTLLLAEEGINGTIAGPRQGIDAVLAHIRSLPGCADLEWKESEAKTQPFLRMKVRLKKEIVTFGQPVKPAERVGTKLRGPEWNELIARDDVAVIDTRNTYETGIGMFRGAIDPRTESFTEFPQWWAENEEKLRGKTIAMYCTGGIRCEKTTAWLLDQGLNEVFHLDGGILKYLEETPEEESLWEGDCFVFDARVAIGHGLKQGDYDLCHACRRPISPEDKASPDYVAGVSCPACASERSAEDKARFAERQKQIALAKKRGEEHLGAKQAPET